MTRIFVAPGALSAETVTLTGGDAVHVSAALRMRTGERLVLCDGEGAAAECVIISSSPSEVVCRIDHMIDGTPELPVRVHLFQSLPKSDKFELIIQKTTELGVCEIVPVISERCISRPDERSLSKKIKRWSDIAREAAQQSGRAVIPAVAPALSFTDAAGSLPPGGTYLFCDEDERTVPLRSALSGAESDIYVFVGPEGGWSPRERALALSLGIRPVTFGPRILRCETAPVYVMSCIGYEFG